MKEDLSLQEFIRKKGFSKDFDYFFAEQLGTEYGTTMEKMGSKATGSLLNFLPHFTEGYILSN
jgi:hypothetical protein